MKKTNLTLENTAKALIEFDKGQIQRDYMHEMARTNEDVAKWEAEEKKAKDKVKEAFYHDTKDRNTRYNCMIVSIEWLRQMVKNPEKQI